VGTAAIGSTILGFYLETSTSTGENLIGISDWYLVKRSGNRSPADFPIPGATGGAANRRWIFHESKGIGQGEAGSLLGGQQTRMREFIKIPKGFRRLAENDKWTIRVKGTTDYNFCLKAIYKVYE